MYSQLRLWAYTLKLYWGKSLAIRITRCHLDIGGKLLRGHRGTCHLDIGGKLIRGGCQNSDSISTAQTFLKTVKTVKRNMVSCNGEYEDVASWIGYVKRSDSIRRPDFLLISLSRALVSVHTAIWSCWTMWSNSDWRGLHLQYHYIWEQDSDPCRTSGKNPKQLSENFCFLSLNSWPLDSSDCNSTETPTNSTDVHLVAKMEWGLYRYS